MGKIDQTQCGDEFQTLLNNTNEAMKTVEHDESLTGDGTVLSPLKAVAGSGSGNVSADLDIVDNAIVKGDGGVKNVQKSGVLIDDLDNIKEALSLAFKNGEKVDWNADFKTLNVPSGTGSTLQVGQEFYFYVHNDTGVLIPNGSVLKPVAAALVGSVAIPTVKLAQADVHTNCDGTLFIATSDIANGAEGMATIRGRASGIDTSTFTGGDDLYLSPTVAGLVTNVRPSFPDYVITLGGALNIHATEGEIAVSFSTNVSDSVLSTWDGGFRESLDFTVSSNGTIITGTLEKSGGGDLTMIFSDRSTILDCTPPQTIELTAGTDTVPKENLVYILKSNKILAVSTADWPTEEHIKVANLMLRSATASQTDEALVNRNWNDHFKSEGNNGHLLHIAERLRKFNATWDSGTLGTCIVSAATDSDVHITVLEGQVYQLHKGLFPAFDTQTGSHIHIVNDFTTPYKEVTNLNLENADANGNTLSGRAFSFVLWGIRNKAGQESHIMINKPTGSYAKNSPEDTITDSLNYAVYSIPDGFKGVGFLIAKFDYILQANGLDWELYSTEDLRGLFPNIIAGGGGGGTGVSTFAELTDTPTDYTGSAKNLVKVNDTEDGLEFQKMASDVRTGIDLVFDTIFGAYYNTITPSNSDTITLNILNRVIGAVCAFYNDGSIEVTNITPTPLIGSGAWISGQINKYWFDWDGTNYTRNIQTAPALTTLDDPTYSLVAGAALELDYAFLTVDTNATGGVFQIDTQADFLSGNIESVAGYSFGIDGTITTFGGVALTAITYYTRLQSTASGYNSSGFAEENATATAIPTLTALTLGAATVGDTEITVPFTNPNSSNEDQNQLYYKLATEPTTWTTGVVAVTGATTFPAQTGLTNALEYDFKAVAEGDGINYLDSADSNEISATPIAAPVFENLGSMRIDALNEGVKMPNVNFWPTNGGLNDVPFSVEFIVKITQTSGGRTFGHLMTDTFAGGGGIVLFQLTSGDLATMILQSSTGNNIKLEFGISSTYNNIWAQFIFTYDGSESETGLNLWINGALQSTTNTESGTYGKLATVTTCDLEVSGDSGANLGVGDFNWSRYFDKELDAADVADLYDTGGFPYDVSLNPTLYANVLVDIPFNSLATLADATKGTDGATYGSPTFTTDMP